MERLDFLKMLGLGGAALAMGNKLKIDESITPEIQDKLLLLKNDILEIMKTHKPKVEVTFHKEGFGDEETKTDEQKYKDYTESEYETNYHYFSVKSIAYNMRYLIAYKIMGVGGNSKIGWWFKDWTNDNIDEIHSLYRNTSVKDIIEEIKSIGHECITLRNDYKWYDNQIDDLTITIARCCLLTKNFEDAELWYGKLTNSPQNIETIQSDYKIFKLKVPKINYTHENEQLRIKRSGGFCISFKNNNDVILDKIKEYKKLSKDDTGLYNIPSSGIKKPTFTIDNI